VLPLMGVLVLLRTGRVRMLVRVVVFMFVAMGMTVFVRVRDPIVGVLMGMRVHMFMLMPVMMLMLSFHSIPLLECT